MSETANPMELVPGEPPKNPKGDLGVRVLSAIVMVAVAAAVLVVGGLWLDVFVSLVALAAFYEFTNLIRKIQLDRVTQIAAFVGGALYIGLAGLFLVDMQAYAVFCMISIVIAVDTFAYFSGRTFGGPKIAPSISPSKTWAGLAGGVVGATVVLILLSQLFRTPLCQWYVDAIDSFGPPKPPMFDDRCHIWSPPLNFQLVWMSAVGGLLWAVVAQAGDFFESWLKRKAGVKDSSALIPGHGGVFDRVDGLIAVAFVSGAIAFLMPA